MAKLYNVKLYYNTGFNRGNVPGDVSVLTAFELTARTFSAIFRRQSRVSTIKIEAAWDDVKDADYCCVENGDDRAYYVINGIDMESDHTALLSLTMDPLLTAGGVNAINIVGGWAQRAHVSDDTPFANVTPEPWAPSQRMIIRARQTFNELGENGLVPIVGATCDISLSEIYATALTTAAGSAVSGTVVYPELPKVYFDTKLVFDGKTVKMPGVNLFNLNKPAIRNGLSAIRSIGIDSAIVSMYQIPADGVTIEEIQTTDGSNYIDRITGNVIVFNPTGFNYIYGTVKNKKACCLYNSYKLVSVSSSNDAVFKAQELYSGGTAPAFRLKFDPAPNGTVYCQPTYFEGQQTANLEHGVAGLPWLAAGYMYGAASGSAMAVANARRQNILTQMNEDYQLAGMVNNAEQFGANWTVQRASAGLSLFGSLMTQDFTGMVQQGLSLAQSETINALKLQQMERDYEQVERTTAFTMGDRIFSAELSGNVVAPELAFPVDINASSYYGNAFVLAQITLGDNDLARFDRFLTMYGYAMDQRLENSMMTNRTKFNYIKASECQITSTVAPMSICDAISDMFNNGVRIWHVAPAGSAYDNNPIREG